MASQHVQRFNINIDQNEINKLNQKLDLTTFPDELDGAAWDYGAPLADIKRLAHHWRHQYSWRNAEAQINHQLPQYTTSVDVDRFGPIELHFVHARSSNPNAIPLLFSHGWPGHFLEVSKLLPLLLENKSGPSFHVIAPSLPNFGFSEGIKAKGFCLTQYAEAFHKLMATLGYDQYVTQGGDFGMAITKWMTILYPNHVQANHTNMAMGPQPSFWTSPLLALQSAWQYYVTGFSAMDKRLMARYKAMEQEGRGYNNLQSTKPQTIGYSQTDSPVGLLAWIYEKLHDWTDKYPWSDDEVLTWVSIYYFSRAGPAAASRIYYENRHNLQLSRLLAYSPAVKLGMSRFPGELGGVPRAWHWGMGPVVHFKDMERGGHFAAYEVPELLAGELKEMFGKGGGAYGCVAGKDGY